MFRLVGAHVARTWEVCAPCRGKMSSIAHDKGMSTKANSWGFAKFKTLLLSVVFCLVFQSTMHTSLRVIQDVLQASIPLVCLAQTRSVLIIKAVQVKQLAFLASFLSDLFESLATLSCRVLCSDSRCVTLGGNSQLFHSGQTNVGPLHVDSLAVSTFPYPWIKDEIQNSVVPKQAQQTLFDVNSSTFYLFHCHMCWWGAISIRMLL